MTLRRETIVPALAILVIIAAIPLAIVEMIQTGRVYLFSRQFLEELPQRFTGSGRFRFILQPTMAVLLGMRGGLTDAQTGHPPYLSGLLFNPSRRKEFLRSGAAAISNLFAMGIIMDVVFQLVLYWSVHPGAVTTRVARCLREKKCRFRDPRKKILMRLLGFVTCGFVLFATGCLHPRLGPQSLPRDRSLYGISLADSWKEQTLLNIVKVRYVDYPVFLDIGSIVASYTLSQNASVGGTIQPSGTNSAVLGRAVTFSNSPTITYVPLTGNAYIRGLTIPLPPETVFAAIQNGFPADSVLLSSVQTINGLRNQQVDLNGITPADPDFRRVRELMRNIQVSGAVRLYIKEDVNKQQTNILGLRA
jgi:hypothetical protein